MEKSGKFGVRWFIFSRFDGDSQEDLIFIELWSQLCVTQNFQNGVVVKLFCVAVFVEFLEFFGRNNDLGEI